jgi:hypothetical protein
VGFDITGHLHLLDTGEKKIDCNETVHELCVDLKKVL